MNIEFKLPALGENIASGDVVSVLVREGDVIAANAGVIELETDKAVVEIPCPHAGKITKVQVAKGQTIKVGQPVLNVEVEGRRKNPRGRKRDGRAGETASGCRRKQATESAGTEAYPPGPKLAAWPANWASTCHGWKAPAKAGGSPSKTFAAAAVHAAPAAEQPEAPPVESPPNVEAVSRPCRRVCWAKTPTAMSAASRCRGFAALSPRK